MLKFLNEETLQSLRSQVRIAPAGFRYSFVTNIFKPEAYEHLWSKYPPVEKFRYVEVVDNFKNPSTKVYNGPRYGSREHHGCIDHLVDLDPIWKDVLAELSSPQAIKALNEATGIKFNSVREFAFNYGKKGCEIKPHLDSSARTKDPYRTTVVCLLYFAPKPGGGPGGTCVYDTDRETILLEAPDLCNSMLFFEQHPDAWHGYKTITADAERRNMQVTYNSISWPVKLKTSRWHRLFCPHARRARCASN